MSNTIIKALFFSIAVHLLLFILMARLPSEPLSGSAPVTEVDIVSPAKNEIKNKKANQQVVRQALAPDALKAEEDASLARFLSEQRQRVKKESQAALNGMTKNSSEGKPHEKAAPTKPAPPQASQNPGKRDLAKEGFEAWNPPGTPQRPRPGSGPSTSGESLPMDVSVGSFTALNTDRFTFYTFYARIEEMIRYRWESRVQNALLTLDRNTLATIGERGWVTSAEFLLSPDGHLQKAMIMKESGLRAFDAAATGAFREANMFPNPPQELVQEDGFIHLKYNFTVNYSPPLVR